MKRSMICMAVVGLTLCIASVVMAQPGGGRGRGGFGGGGFGGGGFGFGGGGLMLLGDENVRKEIGLSDDKYEQLQTAQRESFQQMGNLFQGLQDLSDDERRTRMEENRKKMTEAQDKIEKQYLTETQRKRLKELSVQSRVNRGGVGEGLASDEIATELGLSEADKDKIRDAAEKAQEELRAQIAKLQEEARKKVIASALSDNQQSKLKTMMGKPFEFSNNFGFAGFGGGGGGRGGFGGGGFGGAGGGRGGPGGGNRGPGNDGGGRPNRPPVERLPDGD